MSSLCFTSVRLVIIHRVRFSPTKTDTQPPSLSEQHVQEAERACFSACFPNSLSLSLSLSLALPGIGNKMPAALEMRHLSFDVTGTKFQLVSC